MDFITTLITSKTLRNDWRGRDTLRMRGGAGHNRVRDCEIYLNNDPVTKRCLSAINLNSTDYTEIDEESIGCESPVGLFTFF